MYMKIYDVKAREIFDSRGYPTIECTVMLTDGRTAISSVPTGKSSSSYEAKPLYDGGNRLEGRGVTKAVEQINTVIAPALRGMEPYVVDSDMQMLALDKYEETLGANSLIAVSMAVCRAQALWQDMALYELIAYLCEFEQVSLPCPLFNVINGGAHAQNNLCMQEFMIVPIGVSNFHSALDVGMTFYHMLGKYLTDKEKIIGVGDEGGYTALFKDDFEALDSLMEVIEQYEANYEGTIMLALDVASSQFYQKKQLYSWHGKQLTIEEMGELYKTMIKNYPIYLFEDPAAEDDWDGWLYLTQELEGMVQLAGDDIFATNCERIWLGIEKNLAQNVIIKPNQIGTITETLQAVKLCNEYGRNLIVSHRSGETNDSFVADLAVGVGAGMIKAGAPCRGERLAKYNRLLEIETELLLDV